MTENTEQITYSTMKHTLHVEHRDGDMQAEHWL